MTTGWTIPRAIVDCIAQAREPSVQELCVVAEHIRADLLGRHDRHGAAVKAADPAARVMSFRAAHAALMGGV